MQVIRNPGTEVSGSRESGIRREIPEVVLQVVATAAAYLAIPKSATWPHQLLLQRT